MTFRGRSAPNGKVRSCFFFVFFAYLDPADSLLGLHHAYVLGGVPLGQQLSGAQVVCSKDDSINQVFWFAWARYCGGVREGTR